MTIVRSRMRSYMRDEGDGVSPVAASLFIHVVQDVKGGDDLLLGILTADLLDDLQ